MSQSNNKSFRQMNKIPWMYCNNCFTMYNQQSKFYFLSCLHLMCHNCLKLGGRQPTCIKCEKQVMMKPVSENMNIKYSNILFSNFNININQMEYQLTNINNLLNHFNDLKCTLMKKLEARDTFQIKMKQYIEYYQKLREFRQSKQRIVREKRGISPNMTLHQRLLNKRTLNSASTNSSRSFRSLSSNRFQQNISDENSSIRSAPSFTVTSSEGFICQNRAGSNFKTHPRFSSTSGFFNERGKKERFSRDQVFGNQLFSNRSVDQSRNQLKPNHGHASTFYNIYKNRFGAS